MSHMPNSFENADVQMYQEPERTSVMAILSMVFGFLGCCTIVTAPLGVLFGLFGLIGISRSKGRVGGKGFAIAGVIVSILAIAIWIGLIVGVGGAWFSLMKKAADNAESVLVEVQNGDFDAARSVLASPAVDSTDAELLAFQAAYQGDVGNYVSSFDSLGELISGYMAVGEQINSYSGRNDIMPIPMRFDSGWVLVIYDIDPTGNSGIANGIPLAQQLVILSADGNEYTIPWDGPPPALPDGSDLLPDTENQGSDDENADDTGGEDPDGP